MKLTAVTIRNAKPKDKQYSLVDGGGLYLLIKPSGKYWRYNYRFMGKQKTLALGVYPEITLKEARNEHIEARKQLSGDVDLAHQRKIEKAMKLEQSENSFKAIALDWLEKKKPSGGTFQVLRKSPFLQ